METAKLIELFNRGNHQPSGHFRRGDWGANSHNGNVYVVKDAKAVNSRIGDCWMKGRILKDDLIMTVGHSGDYFHTYVLIKQIGNGFKFCEGSNFGAYGFGDSVSKVAEFTKEQAIALIEKGFLPFARPPEPPRVEYKGQKVYFG